MLLLSSDSITVDGATVFPDHADPNQFWYLPAPVDLAKMPDSDEPQFLLIEYAPDLASSGVKGVGFLNVTTCLKISDQTSNKILGQIQSMFPTATSPHLAPVPFDEGTVRVVALDMQGSGGATNTAPPGTFEAVEKISGATSPELFGDNDALFSLTLTEEGVSILKAAFEDGMAPVGVIYDLKFTGVRPALEDHRRSETLLRQFQRRPDREGILGVSGYRRDVRETASGWGDQDRGRQSRRRPVERGQGAAGTRHIQGPNPGAMVHPKPVADHGRRCGCEFGFDHAAVQQYDDHNHDSARGPSDAGWSRAAPWWRPSRAG